MLTSGKLSANWNSFWLFWHVDICLIFVKELSPLSWYSVKQVPTTSVWKQASNELDDLGQLSECLNYLGDVNAGLRIGGKGLKGWDDTLFYVDGPFWLVGVYADPSHLSVFDGKLYWMLLQHWIHSFSIFQLKENFLEVGNGKVLAGMYLQGEFTGTQDMYFDLSCPWDTRLLLRRGALHFRRCFYVICILVNFSHMVTGRGFPWADIWRASGLTSRIINKRVQNRSWNRIFDTRGCVISFRLYAVKWRNLEAGSEIGHLLEEERLNSVIKTSVVTVKVLLFRIMTDYGGAWEKHLQD